MKIFSKTIIIVLISSICFAEVYSDGTNPTQWQTFTSDKGVISSENGAIKLLGNGTRSGYFLRLEPILAGATTIQCRLRYSNYFTLYVQVLTTEGIRYLTYYPLDNANLSRTGRFLPFEIGKGSRNGEWYDFKRDIGVDLAQQDAGNRLLEVRAFFMRGSGEVDDIELLSENETDLNSQIYIIGDSTVHNRHGKHNGTSLEMGWADTDALGSEMLTLSNLYNEARAGSSSKSYKIPRFRKNDWEKTKEIIRNRDTNRKSYLLVQFGHNDASTLAFGTTPTKEGENSFYQELEVYVDWARDNGLTPILITPVEIRSKVAGENNKRTHQINGGDYAQIVRELAVDKNILLLDLAEKSWNEYNKYRDTNALNRVFSFDDDVHFSPNGAKIVGEWVKELICDSSDTNLCAQFKP
ncbi:MAG: hypothetical protein KAG56_02645 [Sulfurovaceae bacterium]|nr:hypothetical protein [Sulfurovaceae bacterium]